jgi:cholesterol oxidase
MDPNAETRRVIAMKDAYGAVVIGSGFGGAVAACRLAQAGVDVAILERGRRYPRGSFPRRFDGLADGWFWAREQGLFDVKPVQEIQVVQAAGYGGGSLIYANVHLRPTADVFARAWPEGYSREALDPYYDLVGYMLDVKPITDGKVIPTKTLLMKKVAEKLGRSEQLCYPNIAVDLHTPAGEVAPNKFGVPQSGCIHCGECDIGCNVHAKNTLDLNYLALAERAGAEVGTQCEVWNIARAGSGEGDGYVVSYRDHRDGSVSRTIHAAKVFVCAGAVNSTELLLRCRDEHGTLPDIGDRLGQGYSGNGDFFAAAYQTGEPFEPCNGPVITTGIVFDRGEGDDRVWFILQDGGFPRQVASFASLLAPGADWLKDAASWLKDDLEHAFRDAAQDGLARQDPPDVANTALFLAMGRDRANGRIELSPLTHALKVTWDVPSNMPLYSGAARLVQDVADTLGGVMTLNPFWKRLHMPVSVHNLGGCIMSDDPACGVTTATGELHHYPGLYVLDGAILPAATGVNPSSTIAAVAERNIETIIRAHLKDPAWCAPQRALAKKMHDPMSAIRVPEGGSLPARTPSVGVAFTETMKGAMARGFLPVKEEPAIFEEAAKAGSPAKFTLKITIPDLDQFLADKAHAGIASGRLEVSCFTPDGGADVTNGVFNLFVKDGSFYERKMLYLLPFTGKDGKPYLFDGYKDVEDHGSFDVWASTSTLYSVIREGHTKSGPVVAAGVLVIHKMDFLHQLTTFEAPGAEGAGERLSALSRFGQSFMGTLWDVFVRPRLP